MNPVFFTKMHGLGNDFVIIDRRTRPVAMSRDQIRLIADRRAGVGCDQLVLLDRPGHPRAQARMRIFNADASEVAACGNATRCVAALLMREFDADEAGIETAAGLLIATSRGAERITVDLGRPATGWREIPLAHQADTLRLDIAEGPLRDPVAVSVGNPHAVFFVDDVERIPLADLGPIIERHPLFPEGTNVEAVEVLDRGRLRVRVWERGVGITPACGTGACAAAVAACRRALGHRSVSVLMDGGTIEVEWRDDDHVVMTGPVAVSFRGVLEPSLLDAVPADA
jgi:diaminopimelate epimerase